MRSTPVNSPLPRASKLAARATQAARQASAGGAPVSTESSPAPDFTAQLAAARQGAADGASRTPPAAARAGTSSGSAAPAERTAAAPARTPSAAAVRSPAASSRSARANPPAAQADAADAASAEVESAAGEGADLGAPGAASRGSSRRGGSATADSSSGPGTAGPAATDADATLAALETRLLGGATDAALQSVPPRGQAAPRAGTGEVDDSASDDDTLDRTSAGAAALPGTADAAQLALLLPMLAALPAQSAVAGAPPGSAASASGGPTGAVGSSGSGGGGATGPVLEGALLADLAHTLSSLGGANSGGTGVGLAGFAGSAVERGADPTTTAALPPAGGDSAAGTLAALDTAQAAARAVAAVPTIVSHVHAAVGSPQWPEELAAQMTLMSAHGIQSAELKLTPGDLGPLQVNIDVQNGAATVWFQAAHADTRAALQQSLPQLREFLAARGMSLADAGVHREPPRDNPRARSANSGGASAAPVGEVAATAATSLRLGLLDAYA